MQSITTDSHRLDHGHDPDVTAGDARLSVQRDLAGAQGGELGRDGGDFATGMRTRSRPRVTGDFATGLRSSSRQTTIGDFATGMRAGSVAVVSHEPTSTDTALPLAA